MVKLEKAELSDGGIHLLVNSAIDGIPIKMVLDTGASHSVLDISWVKAHLSHEDMLAVEDPAHGIGSSVEVHKLIIPKIAIGELIISNHSVALIDFSSINAVYSNEGFEEVQGILGGDLLFKHNAVIDYKSMLLSFSTDMKN